MSLERWRPHSVKRALPRLKAGSLQLWRVSLSEAFGGEELLTRDERARARRYRDAALGARWARSRSALRLLLAGHARCAPEAIGFVLGPHGKPSCARPLSARAIAFNLSHSQDVALIALARGDQPLGVDIERVIAPSPRRDLDLIASRVFSDHERARLSACLTPEEKTRRFYAIWTQKEAYIKALGWGMHLDLKSFDMSDEEPAGLLRASHEGARSPEEWAVKRGALRASSAYYAFAWCAPARLHDEARFELTRGE